MPILKFEQLLNESNNTSYISETEKCIIIDSFQDQFLSGNWHVAIRILQKYPDLTKRANTINELPLHTALWINAPDDIILAILRKNKDAVYHQNNKRQLPLHLAIKYASSLKVIEDIIRMYPQALDDKDDVEMTPRDYGKIHGRKVNDLLRFPVSFWIAGY